MGHNSVPMLPISNQIGPVGPVPNCLNPYPEKSGFRKRFAGLSSNFQDGFLLTYTPTSSTREPNSAVRLPENRSPQPLEATHLIIENLKPMIQNNVKKFKPILELGFAQQNIFNLLNNVFTNWWLLPIPVDNVQRYWTITDCF